MKKTIGFCLLFGLFLFTSCKSNFEKIRSSGDVELILKNAFLYYEKKDYLKAQTLFELVMNNLRGRSEAEKAYYYYADCHFQLREFVLAAYYFKNFSNSYTNSAYREDAAFMSAYSNYKQSPLYRLDQTPTVKAIEEFQTFVNLFPDSKRVDECNKLIDECRRKLEQKAMAEGELYFNLRQYQSATISFDNLLKDYPETIDAEKVRYLIARSGYLLSENSVVEKQEDRYRATMTRCDDFLDKYPNGKYTKEVKDMKRNAEKAIVSVRKRMKGTKV